MLLFRGGGVAKGLGSRALVVRSVPRTTSPAPAGRRPARRELAIGINYDPDEWPAAGVEPAFMSTTLDKVTT